MLTHQKEKDLFPKLSLALKSILDLPRLKIVNPAVSKKNQLKVVKYMENYGLRPRDAYHLLAMKSNKIAFLATFDRDFKKAVRAGEVEMVE